MDAYDFGSTMDLDNSMDYTQQVDQYQNGATDQDISADYTQQDALYTLLDELSDQYHNGVSTVSDQDFDTLVDYYESKYGTYEQTGVLPRGEQVPLPYYLTGLEKIKDPKQLELWSTKNPGPYVVEDKIDGITLLYTRDRLYTRGKDGIGKDVSHLFGTIQLPTLDQDIAVRGELVMLEKDFAKYSETYSNARNLVSGVVNAKEAYNPDIARDMRFIAYQIMGTDAPAADQIMRLGEMGFETPWAALVDILDFGHLKQLYQDRVAAAPYKMDGLVVYQNTPNAYPTEGLPKYIMAFKVAGQAVETTVTHVTWEPSKDRLLKPVVHYTPVVLSGVKLEKASGDNARYILNSKIGPGAKILVTRSGDVVPRIVAVLKPATVVAWPTVPCVWNVSQTDLMLTEDTPEVQAARIHHFFDTLGIKKVGLHRAKAFVADGLVTVDDIVDATPKRLAQVVGIGRYLCKHIYDQIRSAPLPRIMAATGIFPGVGVKRFEAILQAYPDLLSMLRDPVDVLTARLQEILGFSQLGAYIASRLHIFADWLDRHPQVCSSPLVVISHDERPQPLAGKTFVFSGFRDTDLKHEVEALGGRIVSNVSRKTTMLVMKDVQDKKGKAVRALELGIPLISKDDFIEYIRA